MPNYLEDYYLRSQNPMYQQSRLNQRIGQGLPILNNLLNRDTTQLNSMGLFSSSPMQTVRAKTIGDYSSGISQDYYQGLDQQTMQMLQMLEQARQAEIERKRQQKASLWGGIGSLLGMGMQFIPGIGSIGGAALDAASGGYTPTPYQAYQPPQMQFTPTDYNNYRRY
jgi:hypothetical protein